MEKDYRIANKRHLYFKSFQFFLALNGLFFLIYFVKTKNLQEIFNNEFLFIFPFAVTAVVSAFFLMNNYLQQTRTKDFKFKDDIESNIAKIIEKFEYKNYEMQEKIDLCLSIINKKIDENVQKEPSINFNDKQKQEIFQSLVNTISTNLTKDFFDSIKESVIGQVIDDKREQIFSIAKRCDSSLIRLKGEIELLTKRANINLIIGSITTISALILLGYFVVNDNFNSDDILKVSLHFIPRLSLVIFIEFFSFFFLKLYRTSLQEIKYYQNELTNLELKQTAIITAANYGTESDISNIIREMSATERNFKLQKGESTIDLEKNKMETQSLKEILKAAIETLGKEK